MDGVSEPRLLPEFDEILAQFEFQSQFVYIACSSLVIVINLAFICFFLRKKFLDEPKVSNVLLISLAISDIAYEATTTPLFLQCDTAGNQTPLSFEYCSHRTLYATYMMFNISTALHLLVEMLQKVFEDRSVRILQERPAFAKYASVFLSFVLWCMSFLLAYVCSWEEMRLTNINAMVYLGRFKGFGYYIFAVVAFCFSALIVVILCVMKPRKAEMGKGAKFFVNESHLQRAETDDREFFNHPQKKDDSHLVSCCFYLAFVVGSFGWLLAGTTGDFMRSIEVMKSFEILRLCARLLNSLTVFFAITKGDPRFQFDD